MRDFLKTFFGGGDDDTVTPVESEEVIRKAVTVSGRVQGVGFRYFVRQEARALNVTGWVMNLRDGTVTMEIQSTPDILANLIARIQKGNGASKVTGLKEYEVPVVQGENKFGIKY